MLKNSIFTKQTLHRKPFLFSDLIYIDYTANIITLIILAEVDLLNIIIMFLKSEILKSIEYSY